MMTDLSSLLLQGALDAARGTLQWAFGRLIANGDMHGGNLSFFFSAAKLTLTPAYEMLQQLAGLSRQVARMA